MDDAKLADVQFDPGQVKICWGKALGKTSVMDRGRRWEEFKVEDLEALSHLCEEQEFTHALSGIACSGARPMVSAKSPYVQAKALLCRVFRLPPERPWGRGPREGIWKWAEQFSPLILGDLRSRRMTDADWLQSMPTQRRRALERAQENYRLRGWSEGYGTFSAFVKTELLPGFSKKGELGPLDCMTDRLIQGPADETHVIAGPWLKPLLGSLKAQWSCSNPVFYGSAGPESLHKFLQLKLVGGEKMYFWCDYSMYDNTHSPQSWDFLENIYRRAGIEDADFWRVMEIWRSPRGRLGAFKYLARVMNASGRDDTALANAILNGIAMVLALTAAWYRIPLCDVQGFHVSSFFPILGLSVCGDDTVGSMPPVPVERRPEFSAAVKAALAEFGFEGKFFVSDRLTDAVYLGCRPYPAGGNWYWGKTIGRATYKMGWSQLKGGRDLMAHITGVADMHVLCSRHVPVLFDLAERIVQLRQGAKRTPPTLDPNKPWEWTYRSGVPYDDSTISAVCEIYSVGGAVVTPGDVWSLIHAIRAVERLPCVLDHWLWKHMVVVDDL